MRNRIFSVLAVFILLAVSLSFFACNNTVEDPVDEIITNPYLHADDIFIFDGDGSKTSLQGTNFGGWLVQEEWLVPSIYYGADNPDGYDADQISFMRLLSNRFGKDKMEELFDIYESSWITEKDFENVKNLGLNCVRIPFTYMNFMEVLEYNADTNHYDKIPFSELSIKENAFERLDWALEMCEKYELYAILDMHGAVGSQSGQDHTGDTSEYLGRLYLDSEEGQICRDKTKMLWEAIASHYKENKWVAAYDIINEPGIATASGGGKSQVTNKTVWDYFDVLYDAIRAVDNFHMICLESCWEAGDLPPLDKYGWENVLYQYHHYNWASAGMANATYYTMKVSGPFGFGIDRKDSSGNSRNYPVLIGEYNVWGDSHLDKNGVGDQTQTDWDAWDGVMELYTGKGWHYTTWTYKHAAGNSSWGLYNCNENLMIGWDSVQANLLTDSYERIAEVWGLHSAANYHENTDLTSIIKKYISSFYLDGIEDTKAPYYILGTAPKGE